MTDREKLVYLIKENAKAIVSSTENGVYVCLDVETLADYLISHGVTVLELQKPLNLEELYDANTEVFLEFYDYYNLFQVSCRKFGDGLNQTELLDAACYDHGFTCANDLYGKAWRCWAEKPTEEERKAAGWE